VARVGRLPTLGATVRKVATLAQNEDSGIGEMVAALEADQGLAADLLRYVNSAACARPLRVRSIRAAVTLAGRKAVSQLAVEAATVRFFERAPGNGGPSIGQLHLHAAAVGGCAESIARRTGADPEIAHLGGLLHDVGKLVMPLAFGELATDAISAAHPAGADRARAERQAFGVDHAGAGALVARGSQVDAAVEHVIAFHHGGPTGDVIPSPEVACVILADEVAGLIARHQPDEELLTQALELLGLDLEALDDIAVEAARGAQLETDVAARLAELEHLARTDDLTGVLNRRHWLATVRRAISAGEQGSVLLCDVDNFKAINDGHGHATGDLVLTEVARRLANHGTTGRLGGDEFALWVPGARAEGDAAADSVLRAVAGAFEVDFEVGVSIGAASPDRPTESVTNLLSRADEALYEAKRSGRGRAVRLD
jgi:diguanylate cyclase (GGDEF)-like protein/putative nucleotidyltransferase with HDIG domain